MGINFYKRPAIDVVSSHRSYARIASVIDRLRRETPDARHAAARNMGSPSRGADARVEELLAERALTIGAIEDLARAHLLYRRGPREGRTVTLAGLRRLLSRAGYD